MLQSCDYVGLGAKTGKVLFTGAGPISEHLDCHNARQRELPSLEDDAHASTPQHSNDFIAWHRRPF